MEGAPTIVKVWLAGFVPIWLAAKIHTFVTMRSGHFVERHWPFWAAMLGWSALVGFGGLLAGHFKKAPTSSSSN